MWFPFSLYICVCVYTHASSFVSFLEWLPISLTNEYNLVSFIVDFASINISVAAFINTTPPPPPKKKNRNLDTKSFHLILFANSCIFVLFRNGDTYAGEYFADKMHGFGVYSFANEHRYEGAWHEGRRQGLGMYTFRNGETQSGHWQNGILDIPSTQNTSYPVSPVAVYHSKVLNAVQVLYFLS